MIWRECILFVFCLLVPLAINANYEKDFKKRGESETIGCTFDFDVVPPPKLEITDNTGGVTKDNMEIARKFKNNLGDENDDFWRAKADPNDPDGCGYPVCVLIDARPRRFKSFCQFMDYVDRACFYFRMFHLQKGDCTAAINKKGHKWAWGKSGKGCTGSKFEKLETCLINPKINRALSFENPCEAVSYLADKTDIITVHAARGKCEEVINDKTYLKTEWFDIDDPCVLGDTESAASTFAYVSTYPKTAPWRFCVKENRHNEFRVETVLGGNIPPDQITSISDDKGGEFICRNFDQDKSKKPRPPYYWYHRKIFCLDYKIQFKCKCQFACVKPDGKEGIPVRVPQVETLFDECNWRPFVSDQIPHRLTWDEESRSDMIQSKKYRGHACGSGLADAQYIDSRRIKDGLSWLETGEIITKNTPSYGFLCINKNQEKHKTCSNYKTRFCCAKAKYSTWLPWTPWSQCSKSCGGGTKKRTRECEHKSPKNDCYGNWEPLKETYSKQDVDCNLLPCPGTLEWSQWSEWAACAVTCGKADTWKNRRCSTGKHGGHECPSRRKEREQYYQSKDCGNPACTVPIWDDWTKFGPCSTTCGIGSRTKSRVCVDFSNKWNVVADKYCIERFQGGPTSIEKCVTKDNCPVDGGWTKWTGWTHCSIFCGKGGVKHRRRYCSNPLPQFGGKECEGKSDEQTSCEGEHECPTNCEWSAWGKWGSCSVTCDGPGFKERMRHVEIRARDGGRECDKVDKMRESCEVKPCPVDCTWGSWGQWQPACPNCYEKHVHVRGEDIFSYRTRYIAARGNIYGKCLDSKGKKFNPGMGMERISEVCPVVKDCKVGMAMWGSWTDWGLCVGDCGRQGRRNRTRECLIHGGKPKSKGDCEKFIKHAEEISAKALIDFHLCPNHCDLVGWSDWDEWSKCPVTCGGAKQARVRRCLGGIKNEITDYLRNEFCNGEDRQKERRPCDIGECKDVAQEESSEELKYGK